MFKKNTRIMVGFISLILLALACLVVIIWNIPGRQSSQVWQTYTDPRYGFTVQVPGNWTVLPRPGDDDPRVKNAVLTFKSPENSDKNEGQIVIGLRSSPYDPSQSLAEWTQRYAERSTVFDPGEIKIIREEYISLPAAGQGEAYYVHGQSPIIEYQFVNILHGDAVWFIWTDLDSSGKDLFMQVVQSFSFGEEPPE